MALNPEKYPFLLLGVDDSLQTNLVYGDEFYKNSKQEAVFGATLDNKSFFCDTRIKCHWKFQQEIAL